MYPIELSVCYDWKYNIQTVVYKGILNDNHSHEKLTNILKRYPWHIAVDRLGLSMIRSISYISKYQHTHPISIIAPNPVA